MSIKKLINALFKLSGGQAMPNPTDRIELQNGITTYIAPFDGWFYTAQSLPQNTRIFVSSNGVEVSIWSPAQNSVVSGGIPVAKGQTVTVEIPESASQYWTYFTKLVGGGAKSLFAQAVRCVRGGLLCLLTSSTRSELGAKVCLQLRKNGSGRNHIRQHLIPKKLTKAAEITKTTYPRLMDTLMCKVIRVTVGSELTLELYLYLVQKIRLVHQVLYFLSIKVHQWLYGVHLVIATLYGTLKIWLRNSLFAKEVCHA